MGNRWKLPPDGPHLDRTDGVYFQNMTGHEVRERLKKNDLIIIPVGSTESHGLAQPYGEDTLLVSRLAEMAAVETGCTVSQPVWYGFHPANQLGMPGNIMIPQEVFVAYLRAIIAGFWNAGFRKQILINGHGQEEVIPGALHGFAQRYQVPAVLVSLHWWTPIHKLMFDKKHGGVFETPFQHADEAECSYSLALFPEMVHLEYAEDNEPAGFIPGDHVDKGGDVYHKPLRGHEQVGFNGLSVISYPEGVVGKPSLADPEKAKPGVEAILDYLVRLINDIMTTFPAGKLPPTEKVTQRSPEEVEALLKGPLNGGRHIYTVAYPP
ncbi:MAG: creatininase family protein [Anaerolineae bacterium]|nr:creatininase family protein [Anaerolineae bacterium]MDH7474591.1 3-dehydro-scyllo-inosose hydrolase [Anaerolineae bacterium]